MKTRAAVLYGLNQPLVVEDLELDEPKEHEVLVRMMASGVCHSDYHVVLGNDPRPLPQVLGHEGAGIVERVGPGVTTVKPGDHITLTFLPPCGECPFCTSGQRILCDKGMLIGPGIPLDGTYRFHKGSQGVAQSSLISTFSEWSVVPEKSCVKIDNDIPLNRACLVGCGVSTGFGAAVNRAKVTPGSSVLVLGCGGVGTSAVQGARAAGASMIIAADIVDFKLEMARKHFGATHTINNGKEDLLAKVKELTNGVGVDYAFEVIATPETIGLAFNATRKGGTCVVVGMMSFTHVGLPIAPAVLAMYQKSLLGTIFGSNVPPNDIHRFLNMYRTGQLKLDEMVTREYRLDQVNDAFNDMLEGRNIRGVIRMD